MRVLTIGGTAGEQGEVDGGLRRDDPASGLHPINQSIVVSVHFTWTTRKIIPFRTTQIMVVFFANSNPWNEQNKRGGENRKLDYTKKNELIRGIHSFRGSRRRLNGGKGPSTCGGYWIIFFYRRLCIGFCTTSSLIARNKGGNTKRAFAKSCRSF